MLSCAVTAGEFTSTPFVLTTAKSELAVESRSSIFAMSLQPFYVPAQ